MKHRSIWVTDAFVGRVLFCVLYALTNVHQVAAQNWVSRDRTGKVFSGLNELALIRDEVLNRYVMVADCEYVKTRGTEMPTITPSFRLNAVKRSGDIDYAATVRPLEPGKGLLNHTQRWGECLKCKGILRQSGGFIQPGARTWASAQIGVDEEGFESRHQASQPMYLDPFDDIFTTSRAYDFNRRDREFMELIFFKRAEFVDSQFITQGNVESSWRYKNGDLDCELKLVQSAANKFLPIEIHYQNAKAPPKEYFCQTRLDWKQYKNTKTWLPYHIHASEMINMGKQRVQREFHFKLQWLVGDDAKDELFQCDSPDFRIPIMEAFEKEYDYFDGVKVVRAPPYERPDDFFLDARLNRK
jgi:hypothetical protein